MIFDYVNVISRNKLSCIYLYLLGHDSKQKQRKQDFSLSLQSSRQMCRLPDQCQVNSTAVSEEVYSEPAINCVWHLKGGVVNLSLEYLVLVEVCIQNTLLFPFDLFQVNKKRKKSPPGENDNSRLVACCWPNSMQLLNVTEATIQTFSQWGLAADAKEQTWAASMRRLSENFLFIISWITWFRIVLSSNYWSCLYHLPVGEAGYCWISFPEQLILTKKLFKSCCLYIFNQRFFVEGRKLQDTRIYKTYK